MKRVLIVSSSFSPATPASVHRARLLAWSLREVGWEVEILTAGREFQRREWLDPESAALFPTDIPCHEAGPVLTRLFHLLGMRGTSWRGWIPMYRLGARLLAQRRFDLVYITTTSFNLFCLGRIWKRHFGIPYVLDFQDPWFRPRPGASTTRHWIKYWVSGKLARYLEAFAVNGSAGLVSVSPNYLADLRHRYLTAKALAAGHQSVIPFGVLPLDLALARQGEKFQQNERDLRTIAYVGVGSALMRRSFRRLMDSVARLRQRHPEIVARCRFRLRGTQGGWQPPDPKILLDEAVAAGVGDLVEEDPRIVSYPVATREAVAADGLLVLGVEDPAYMPSKLFLYAATGKPLLACLCWESQVDAYFERLPELGALIHFGAPARQEAEDDARLLGFLREVIERRPIHRERVLAAHSASAMARQHAALFTACLEK